MSRPKLINKLKIKHPTLNKSQLEIIVDTFFNSIKTALKKKKQVKLRDFGFFFVKAIKEKYTARNPNAGEVIYVPKKNRIRFRISKKFKMFLNK